MRTDDGRVVTQFISQALEGAPLTVYGDGSQTRSLCYVSDLVRGFVAMIDGTYFGPVNLGNAHELTIRQIAELVRDLVGSDSPLEFRELPDADPKRRRPGAVVASAAARVRSVGALRGERAHAGRTRLESGGGGRRRAVQDDRLDSLRGP